jgi:Zn-dependent peptidase ImmA (M78 family)
LSPDLPIPKLVRSIEMAGVLVLALPVHRDPVDAFSAWIGQFDQIPAIAILSSAPADRQRWSVAHELGHLVLHRSMRGGTAQMEDEANRFAAEFLTPDFAMEAEIVPPVTLMGLRDLKMRWRVSMRSLVNRAFEVGAVTPRQRSYLFMKLNATFGGRSEPVGFPAERPRALRQLFEMVYGLEIDFDEAGYDLKLSPHMLKDFLQHYQGAADSDPLADGFFR